MGGSVNDDVSKGCVKLLFIDVKKARLNGRLGDDEFAFIQLPPEAGGGVGRLRRWLYGMRAAASAWEDEYVAKLISIGFLRGRSASTVFWHPATGMRLVVWGDDFTGSGHAPALDGRGDVAMV